VHRLLAGDEEAFVSLVDQLHGRLIRLALAFVRSRAVAEEVAQETWMGVLRGLPAFEGRSSLEAWILRILVNRARTRGVREARSVPFSALSEPTGDADAEEGVDPARFKPDGAWLVAPRRWNEDALDRLIMQREAIHSLEQAIDQLPANQRAVVAFRDIQGLDSEHVCNVLGISETNQRVLLHRARSRLRSVLERYLESV